MKEVPSSPEPIRDDTKDRFAELLQQRTSEGVFIQSHPPRLADDLFPTQRIELVGEYHGVPERVTARWLPEGDVVDPDLRGRLNILAEAGDALARDVKLRTTPDGWEVAQYLRMSSVSDEAVMQALSEYDSPADAFANAAMRMFEFRAEQEAREQGDADVGEAEAQGYIQRLEEYQEYRTS